MVSTNNPVFMSICLDVAKSVHPHSYLFEDAQRVTLEPPKLAGISKPVLNTAQQEDFEVAVEFCVQTIAPPREWLEGYYQRLIDRQELFLWQDAANNQILGVCEARKSDTQPGVGDVGMIVSKNYRKQGVGSYLLNQAKEHCYHQGLKPICSCEKDNIGSRKSIQRVGFVARHRLVRVDF